jgi:hypothetical protein
MMICMSLVSLAAGVTISCGAATHPRHQRTMETVAGLLLIIGLALLGYMMEGVVGPL